MRMGLILLLRGYGGVYQYTLNILQALVELKKSGSPHEFIIFTEDLDQPEVVDLIKQGWVVQSLDPPSRKKFLKYLVAKFISKFVDINRLVKYLEARKAKSRKIKINTKMHKWFKKFGTELLIYPSVHPLSFEAGIPYIMAIHDIQHRIQPEFPEVSEDGEWGVREYMFRNGVKYALFLLADSKVGRNDILRFYKEYGANGQKVKILPYLPAYYLLDSFRKKQKQANPKPYDLPQKYIFYPAQFWPHKNHLRIIQALGLLKRKRNLDIPFVCCGMKTGGIREYTFNEVIEEASLLGISQNIHYLDYVEDEVMYSLYKKAQVLVMPTFFGPTNIPVLEAWAVGCPVLTSDIRGIREQVGNAALVVDPSSIDEIADGIYQLWTQEDLRKKLIARGKRRLSAYTFSDYCQKWKDILQEAEIMLKKQK